MMTTSRIIWRPSQRSSSAAILVGQFEQLDEQLSRLHLQARIKPFYLLGVVLIPLYFTVFFFYIPWPRAVVIVSLALMYLFSWLNRRYTARLEAFEMVHFIRTVLNDVIPMPAELPAATSQQSGEFEAVWERFYEEHKAD
jgi:ABC-type protease/lipase transport system fused ATPase/permease subunit